MTMSDGPGWHPDPLGRAVRRYRNEAGWTDHVVDRSGAPYIDPFGIEPRRRPRPTGGPGPPAGRAGVAETVGTGDAIDPVSRQGPGAPGEPDGPTTTAGSTAPHWAAGWMSPPRGTPTTDRGTPTTDLATAPLPVVAETGEPGTPATGPPAAAPAPAAPPPAGPAPARARTPPGGAQGPTRTAGPGHAGRQQAGEPSGESSDVRLQFTAGTKRRYLQLVFAVIGMVATVVLTLLGRSELEIWANVWAAIYNGVATAVMGGFGVVMTTSGITLRGWSTRHYSWADVRSIEPVNFLGARRVQVRLTGGTRIRPWAPYDDFLLTDLKFDAKVAAMQEWFARYGTRPDARGEPATAAEPPGSQTPPHPPVARTPNPAGTPPAPAPGSSPSGAPAAPSPARAPVTPAGTPPVAARPAGPPLQRRPVRATPE